MQPTKPAARSFALRVASLALGAGLAAALVACDEAPPEETEDTAVDTADASSDVPDEVEVDTTPDVEEDVPVDVVDTAPEVDVVEDVADEEVADEEVADVADEEVADVVDEEVEVPDTGVDCSTDETLCADPFVCMDGVCRIPIASTTWAESDFDIVEPEELVRIFEFLKSFADGVKFLVLDLGEGTTEVAGTYGAANIVDAEASPIQVRYQPEYIPGDVTFRPEVSDEAPLHGEAWISDPFLYELRATATVEFPTLDPVTASFGLDAEEVVLSLDLAADVLEENTARLVGIVTREEAEYRTMADRDEIPGFAGLFCIRTSHDPGAEWNLSDILDCNDAVMDVDTDGDDINDAYRVVIAAEFGAALLVE